MNVFLPCYHPNAIARYLARLAVKALYYEVKAYPKPGLVSFVDAGAHDDMDGQTFYQSLFTLRHYFYQITLQGLANRPFEQLKRTALIAEQRMLSRTEGVNTHRGAIFALGLCCISSARLMVRHAFLEPDALHWQLQQDWSKILTHHTTNASSPGSQAIHAHHLIGAKQMAIQGYAVVFQLLTAFLAIYEQTLSLDGSCWYAYSYLLLNIDDTNIVHRCGLEGLISARQCIKMLLSEHCLQQRRALALDLHVHFSTQRISPGGVGDLIAVSLFMGQLFHEGLRCRL